MFERLGSLMYRRRHAAALLSVLLAVAAAVVAPGVADAVRTGGFHDPGAESTAAAEALEEELGRSAADVVLVVEHPSLPVEDPAFASTVGELVAGLPQDALARAVHPWVPGLPPEAAGALLGEDGRSALVVLTLSGADDDARGDQWAQLEDDVVLDEPWQVGATGTVPILSAMQHTAEEDIVRAELLAMPVLLLLMTVLFGGVVAALLPLAVGAVAIVGAMALLRVLAGITDVSTFALNVTTILGLGLAIDYALFVVSRFREELGAGRDTRAAVVRTVATAGRTVAFSGLTVLIAFAGLLLFPHMFLRSMGLGGMVVVVLDMVLALTLLPALLALLGRRVDAGRLPRGFLARLSDRSAGRPASGAGRRPAGTRVLRRPWLLVTGVTAGLALVAAPALDLRTGTSDLRDLPADSAVREAQAAADALFPGDGTTVDVVVRGPGAEAAAEGLVPDLAALPGALGAQVAAATPTTTHLVVATAAAPDDDAARELVRRVRALPEPAGAEVLVGGETAVVLDSTSAIAETLPWTLAVVAGVTLVLLFLALGSVLVPVKAVVMNTVSLAATVGAVVWAFGAGNLSGALGFTETGRVDPANLVLVGLVAFGLAMDYELFLLSRIREAHLAGATPAVAIGTGLERSRRTITSAAVLLVVVLVAMATSDVAFLQLIGLGLAFAVVLDATVVRMLLVPATMLLLGRAAWWLPRPLARLHARVGLSEGEEPPAATVATAATSATAPMVPTAPGDRAPDLAAPGR